MNQKKPKFPAPNMLTKIVECPICLEVVRPPVCQCEVGHAMCKSCYDQTKLKACLLCKRPVTCNKHVVLEQLLEGLSSLQLGCQYAVKGCAYTINPENKDSHERDCRYRTFKCEGKSFAGWKCNWTGNYSDIHSHFRIAHKNGRAMDFKTDTCVDLNFNSNFKDVNVVSFFNGQAFFYYKHFVDVEKEKVYWAFQLIGLRSNASNFYYEFEIFEGPLRKFKVSEVCHNDTTNIEDIFQLEKCVVMSFASAKNFINDDGKLSFRFRIRKCPT